MIKWLLGVAPKVGSKWSSERGNPWKDLLTVVDVKKGFVKYKYPIWTTSLSCSIREFRLCYREIKP